MHFCAQDGFAVMGVTIFAGLAMLVVAFSILAQYGLLARIGPSGISLAVLLILVLMAGVHQGLRRIKSRRFRTGGKDPLFMRAFMQSCYAGDCGRIAKALADTRRTPLLIMHGKNDPRVHPSQSLELHRHLKTLGQAPDKSPVDVGFECGITVQ